MENKQLICDLLLKTLQATRAGEDISSLEYNECEETVIIRFENGFIQNCNVAVDSGCAMILDIIKQLL